MNKWISVVGLCLVAQTVANTIQRGIASSVIEHSSIEEVGCLSTAECSKTCLLGYQEDERGCLLCEECRKERTFRSDILVNDETYNIILRVSDTKNDIAIKENRANFASEMHEWPSVNGEVRVPYTFHSSITDGSRTHNMIMRAFEEFHNKTCIRFVERMTELNYIEFKYSNKCASAVGMVGGKQNIFFSSGCSSKFGYGLHEMMHALGFLHEQSRPDRDNYVTILWENIGGGRRENFFNLSIDQWDSLGSPYDIYSVLHYSGNAFSKQKGILPTIVYKSNNETAVGQRDGFSTQDLFQLNTKYSCSDYLPHTICEDVASGCPTNVTKCNLKPMNKHSCRKSCGYCVPKPVCEDVASGCPTNVTKCNLKPMNRHSCRKSCGYCVPEPVCEDIASGCPTNAAKCNLKPMNRHSCRKSCGYCGV